MEEWLISTHIIKSNQFFSFIITHDWAPKAKEVGLSEYVLQAKSDAWVEKVSKVGNYI